MTLILNYTNDFHHLFYKKIYMNDYGLFPIVEIIQGPWYWVNIIYTYFLIGLGYIICSIVYMKSVSIIKKQILIVMIAYMFPFAFYFSGILFSYAIKV